MRYKKEIITFKRPSLIGEHQTENAVTAIAAILKLKELGYNFRMPNINAALACAQLEQLPVFLDNKRRVPLAYSYFA